MVDVTPTVKPWGDNEERKHLARLVQDGKVDTSHDTNTAYIWMILGAPLWYHPRG